MGIRQAHREDLARKLDLEDARQRLEAFEHALAGQGEELDLESVPLAQARGELADGSGGE
ncbi:hypothetical protein D3C86_2249680 [compost metagenome]